MALQLQAFGAETHSIVYIRKVSSKELAESKRWNINTS